MSSPNNNNNNNNNANQLPGGEDIEKSPPPPKTLDECLEEVMATNAVTRLKRKHKSAESGYVRHTAARLLPHIDFQRNLKLQQKYLGYSDSTVPSTPLAAATAAVAAIVESSEDQRPQPDTLHMCQAGYVRHTAARLLPLLDFEKILQMSQKLRHALDEPTSTVQLASVPQTSQEEEEEEENGDKNDHTANHSDEQPRMVTRSRSSLVVFAMSMTHSSSQMSLMSLFATDATSAELVVSDAAAAAAAADIDPDHQSDTNATQVNADESSPTPRQVPSRPFNFDQYLSELNLVKMHRVLSAESIAPTTHKHDANRGAPEASFVTTRRLETDQSGLQSKIVFGKFFGFMIVDGLMILFVSC